MASEGGPNVHREGQPACNPAVVLIDKKKECKLVKDFKAKHSDSRQFSRNVRMRICAWCACARAHLCSDPFCLVYSLLLILLDLPSQVPLTFGVVQALQFQFLPIL